MIANALRVEQGLEARPGYHGPIETVQAPRVDLGMQRWAAEPRA
ncbi:MAG: hypothetical protein ABIK89_07655 [Planctomycetota bacterium]